MSTPYNALTGALNTTRRGRTSITRPANTTAYTIGDVVNGNSATTPIALPVGVNSGEITQVVLETNNETVTLGTFRIHFFSGSFTIAADNAIFATLHANRAVYCGFVDLPILALDAAGAGAAQTKDDDLRIPFEGSTIYAVIVALGAYVPASAQVFHLTVGIRP